MVNDYVLGMVTGRRPLSDLSDLRERWAAGGGDAMRAEFESQLRPHGRAPTARRVTVDP
ncbi:MAG TPA: hypothetical protein GXZ45_01435 [Propionibacterium sp.]|nr:hypothetical protein [Propionibacterium sp.]